MNTKLQDTIKEEMANIQKESQEAINAFDWIENSEKIGKKYLLNNEKLDNFQLETFLVLLGLVDKEKYIQNIEKKVGMSNTESIKIANETIEKIIIPIINYQIEKIKDNLKTKNQNWKQNLNFVVSGGDYSVFIGKDNPKSTTDEIPKTTLLGNSSKIADIKSKFTI